MKASFRKTAFCSVLAFALAQNAPANLVQNGDFSSVTLEAGYSGPALTAPYFGEMATGATGQTPTPVLTVTDWGSTGYNYVYTANATFGTTADAGTNGGALSGAPNQAPGQFNTGAGYGNTYMWGKNNGGTTTITLPPGGGNFLAADGAYETGAITQSISGLTVGQTYVLKFEWAAAQQQSLTGATTEKFIVSMGTGNVAGNFSTTTYNLPSEGFSGWMSATMYFYANSTTETLSFLASGTPNGEPPFTLLADVDLEVVPDFSNWMVFAGFGAACIIFEVLRRRRRSALALAA